MRRIAVIPGDGVGAEVVGHGLRVLEAASAADPGFAYETVRFPWGSEHYLSTGSMMDPDALEQLAEFDAIYFGAVGSRSVPDHVTLWGLRLAIVQGFDQAISLRPARLLPGIRSPLAARGPDEIDFVVVRENTEGEYAGVGGFAHRSQPTELALQTSVYTRSAIERTARYAFELARTRPARRVASVTKSNASLHASVLWDRVVGEVATEFPDVAFESLLVDAAAARLVLDPASLDVIVASNLHGDILSDLTGALAGSLGMAPSANLHLDGRFPSMFEPVHGSALDIAGQGVANPVGAILSAAMMLDELGTPMIAERIRLAVATACAAGTCTRDVGGRATSAQVTDAIITSLRNTTLEVGRGRVVTVRSVSNQFADWIAAYETAWRTVGTAPLERLFTEDATYQAAPFDEPLAGVAAIAQFWEDEREGPDEVFTLTSEIVAAEGDTAVARLEIVYGDPPQHTYRDLWIITLSSDGRCRHFEEWPFHPGQSRTAL